MASAATRQLLQPTAAAGSRTRLSRPPSNHRSVVGFPSKGGDYSMCRTLGGNWGRKNLKTSLLAESSPGSKGVAPEKEDGVSLGTMKLPLDTDLPRFETLLFQWANSLCQGANVPLPMPLKVDKIAGGARLGFITIGDEGKTEVPVYIDCLVYPAAGGSGPMFLATRNGLRKDKAPPGEERIMRSLLQALKKSVEIARV